MTVAELITILQSMPQNLRVMVDGYEDGVDVPAGVTIETIEVDYWSGSIYFGRHQICASGTEKICYISRV